MPGCFYEVYINTILLLRYSPNMAEKDVYDYKLQIKEMKEKWIRQFETDRIQIEEENCIF